MDPVLNPYAPGAGRPPAALVGRDQQLRSWTVALDRIGRGATDRSIVLYGLRGVGKTVLLSQYRDQAENRAWMVAQVEAGIGKPLRELVGEGLHRDLVTRARPGAGARLLKALRTALSFKASYDATGAWNFGLDLSGVPGGGADTGVLEADLANLVADLADCAAEDGVGLALLIDEAQDLSLEELTALCAVIHKAGQRQWPFLVALAGLPSLPRVLAEAKSYSERLFTFESIEQLTPADAAQALRQPALAEHVDWHDDALEFLVDRTAGYPYFLQQLGQDSWNEATGSDVVLNDARMGAAVGTAALDRGFFRARWDRATRAEQAYLRAMAEDGELASSTGQVATRLERKLGSLGPTRANLIAKGLIYAPEHGVVAFTVPLMADFIRRQPT